MSISIFNGGHNAHCQGFQGFVTVQEALEVFSNSKTPYLLNNSDKSRYILMTGVSSTHVVFACENRKKL